MLKHVARVLVGVIVFVGFTLAGLFFASHVVPHHLRTLIEHELSVVVHSPVTIERVRIRLGRGLVLRGENVTTWLDPRRLVASQPEGVDFVANAAKIPPLDPMDLPMGLRAPGLYAGRVDANLDLFALIAGSFRVSRITLVDTILQVTRDAEGKIRPAPIAKLLTPRDRGPDAEPLSSLEELLLPLGGIKAAVEFLLSKPFVTPVWELRNCVISLRDGSVDGSSALPAAGTSKRIPHVLSLRELTGALRHGQRHGGSSVSLRGRLYGAERRESGLFEWVGTRGQTGAIRTTLATTGFDLGQMLPYARAESPDASLQGKLSGALAYEAVWSEKSRLDIDFVVQNLKTSLVLVEASELGELGSDRADAHFVMNVTPESVEVLRAQFASGALDLKAKGIIDRPLDSSSVADLAVSFHDVELAPLFERAGWLPERAKAHGGREPIKAGRIATLTARGAAPVSVWMDLFAGQTSRLPSGFAVDGEVVDAELRVGDSDRLENVVGHVTWSADQVRLTGATGMLNGSPLPTMDLTVEGVSHLFATRSSQRSLRSGGKPLLGLGAFWGLFQSEPEEEPEPSEISTTLWLRLDTLEHPMFVWPIADVWAKIEPILGGVHITLNKGLWAGVPVYGDADWIFEPEERLSMRLTAASADASTVVDADPGSPANDDSEHRVWASGHITIDAIESESWRHKNASSAFTARDALLQFDDVVIKLEPTGILSGSASVDLERSDSISAKLEFELNGGDLHELTQWVTLPEGSALGQLELEGEFHGRMRPGMPLLRDIEGQMKIGMRNGSLQRGIPPIVSVALSSKAAINPFKKRKRINFDQVDTVFKLDDGIMRTDSFVLDGPDLRLHASGQIDLVRKPHDVQIEVAVFLFRQIDRAIGRIPLLNKLLLGEDNSFQAAYYELSGPWDDTEVKFFPMRTFASGPASLVLERVPKLLKRGFNALGKALSGSNKENGKKPKGRHKNPARKKS